MWQVAAITRHTACGAVAVNLRNNKPETQPQISGPHASLLRFYKVSIMTQIKQKATNRPSPGVAKGGLWGWRPKWFSLSFQTQGMILLLTGFNSRRTGTLEMEALMLLAQLQGQAAGCGLFSNCCL